MKSLMFICSLLLFVSCGPDDKQAISPVTSVVFGAYYGMCAGYNCVRIYSVNSNYLYKDDSASYPSIYAPYTFVPTQVMAPSRFDIAKDLLQNVPDELAPGTQRQYGCPDCHDQGGVYIEIHAGSLSSRFFIDNDATADQSTAVEAYKKRVIQVLQQL